MVIAKTGFLADFQTGYLQRALPLHKAAVVGGTDESYDGKKTGYAVNRLVKLTYVSGLPVLVAPSNVTATSIGDATHIIAQSDDTLRNVPEDAIRTEQYTTRVRRILANTANATDYKTVAVFKIVDATDIKLIPMTEIEVLSMKAILNDATEIEIIDNKLTMTQNAVLARVEVLVNHDVTLIGTPKSIVTIAGVDADHGLVTVDGTNAKKIIVTPSGSNGVAATLGTFDIRVDKGAVKEIGGVVNEKVVVKLTVVEGA